jgi:hypothetical protein
LYGVCIISPAHGAAAIDLETHKRNVARALGALDDALTRFVDALAHEPVWIRIDGARTERDARRRACEAFAATRYDMEDERNESPVCTGVIGASADLIARAERVNVLKGELKEICAPLQRQQMRVPLKGGEGGSEKLALVRVVLRAIQHSDLNLLAAYRKIPILGAPPESVTFTRARTRAVYRKSVDEIFNLLATSESPIASADRARLAALAPSETHLALVKDHYENIRANVRYRRLDARGRGRVQVAAELPLLYAQGRHPAEPAVSFPSADAADTAPRRERTSRIEPDPYLLALPVHRYRR